MSGTIRAACTPTSARRARSPSERIGASYSCRLLRCDELIVEPNVKCSIPVVCFEFVYAVRGGRRLRRDPALGNWRDAGDACSHFDLKVPCVLQSETRATRMLRLQCRDTCPCNVSFVGREVGGREIPARLGVTRAAASNCEKLRATASNCEQLRPTVSEDVTA